MLDLPGACGKLIDLTADAAAPATTARTDPGCRRRRCTRYAGLLLYAARGSRDVRRADVQPRQRAASGADDRRRSPGDRATAVGPQPRPHDLALRAKPRPSATADHRTSAHPSQRAALVRPLAALALAPLRQVTWPRGLSAWPSSAVAPSLDATRRQAPARRARAFSVARLGEQSCTATAKSNRLDGALRAAVLETHPPYGIALRAPHP